MEIEINIVPLTKDIITCNLAVFTEMSSQLIGDYWTLDHYLAELDRKWDLSSVVYADNKLCGFIIVSEKEDSLHVNRIVVAKEFKRHSIGKLLIEKAIRDTRELNKSGLTLKVDAVNNGAINFYKKFNFEQTGTQGELLLMKLKLAE